MTSLSLSLSLSVEIAAKVFHGYHAGAGYAGMDEKRLDGVVGREYVPDPSAQRVA